MKRNSDEKKDVFCNKELENLKDILYNIEKEVDDLIEHPIDFDKIDAELNNMWRPM